VKGDRLGLVLTYHLSLITYHLFRIVKMNARISG